MWKKNRFNFLIDSARLATNAAGKVCIKVEINLRRWFSFLIQNLSTGWQKTSFTTKKKKTQSFSLGPLLIYLFLQQQIKQLILRYSLSSFTLYFFFLWKYSGLLVHLKFLHYSGFKRHDIVFRLRIHFLTRWQIPRT